MHAQCAGSPVVAAIYYAIVWYQFSSPPALQWVFSAANYAFSAVSSGSLSIDCLLSTHHNTAVQRILVHLAVPVLVLAAMVLIQVIW